MSLAFVDIALHRRGPQDLPASRFLFGLVLVVYFAISLTALQMVWALPRATAVLVVEVTFFLIVIWAVLKLFNKERRFLQTAAAMVGAHAFLNLIWIPLQAWGDALQAPPTELTAPQFLLLLLLIWSVDIGGYIFSKALEKPYILGVSIMIVYVLISDTLRQALFPSAV